jgi:ADP-ribose pyrophosphatase YjhB (NUDIX family)
MAKGGRVKREYPDHPVTSAAAVVFMGDTVLLIRRGFPPRAGIWTFPGGAVEVGETAREACAREVLEETGLTVNVGPVVDAVDIMEQDGSRYRYHFTVLDFLAEIDPSSGGLQPASDACAAVWAPLDDLARYDLAPLAQHVLARALWMRAGEPGPLLGIGARTTIG